MVDESELEERMRAIAREEISSLAGLGLRRAQERNFTRSIERNMAIETYKDEAAEFWGEVLADFSGRTDPGLQPGKE